MFINEPSVGVSTNRLENGLNIVLPNYTPLLAACFLISATRTKKCKHYL